MKILISLLLFSSIVAEIFRVRIITSNGISLVDIFLIICFITGVSWFLFKGKKIYFFKGFYFLLIFLILGLISLIINIGDLSLNIGESFSSLFYLLRYVFASFLALIVYNLKDFEKSFILKSLFLSSFIILMIGFLQMKFFGDFDAMNMEDKGWDPHIGRMLSTWFDPNFLGGYFVFVLSIGTGKFFDLINTKGNKNYQFLLLILITGLLIGTILTFSRSALLALFVSGLILGFFLSRKLLIVGFILMLISLSLSGRMQERVMSGIESAKAIVNSDQHALDPTARLRVQSWKTGIQIYKENPVIGIGFNTLKFVQSKKWSFVKDHASSGIDSSIITIMAMTGSIGLLFFISFIFSLLGNTLKMFYKSRNGYSIGLFAGISSLLVNSIFVNSLFFYALIPSFFIAIGLFRD